MTPQELVAELIRLPRSLDDALAYLRKMAQEWATAEDAYRLARAKAILNADGDTVSQREAQADIATSEERVRAHYADAMHKAAREAVRSRQAQLSAFQTVARVMEAEIELAKYGPDVSP